MRAVTLDDVNNKMIRGEEFALFLSHSNYPVTDGEAKAFIGDYLATKSLEHLPVFKIQDPEHSLLIYTEDNEYPEESGFLIIRKAAERTLEEEEDIFDSKTPAGCSGVEGGFHSLNAKYVKTALATKMLAVVREFKVAFAAIAVLIALHMIFPSLYSSLFKMLTPYGVYNIALLLFVSFMLSAPDTKEADMALPRAILKLTMFWFYVVAVLVGNGAIYLFTL